MEDDSTAEMLTGRPVGYFPADVHLQARVELAVHRLDVETCCCMECGQTAPCPTANEAAGVLLDLGVSLVESHRDVADGHREATAAPLAAALRRRLFGGRP